MSPLKPAYKLYKARLAARIEAARRSDWLGFTLVELAIAVAIIGILATVAIMTFTGQRTDAQDRQAQSALRNAVTILSASAADTDDGNFPGSDTNELLTAVLGQDPPFFTIAKSEDPDTVSTLRLDDTTVLAAALSESGTCWAARASLDGSTTYGSADPADLTGAECSATAINPDSVTGSSFSDASDMVDSGSSAPTTTTTTAPTTTTTTLPPVADGPEDSGTSEVYFDFVAAGDPITDQSTSDPAPTATHNGSTDWSANGGTFNGTDDWVEVPPNIYINNGGPHPSRTVQLAFEATETLSTQVLYKQGHEDSGLTVYIGGGNLNVSVYGPGIVNGGPSSPITATAPISDSTIYDVVVRFDGTAGNLEVDLDDAPAASASVGAGSTIVNGSCDTSVGAAYEGGRDSAGTAMTTCGSGAAPVNFFAGTIHYLTVHNSLAGN